MPTPFTHLRSAQQLLQDTHVAAAHRDILHAERSAFLLGNIAADARVNSGINRVDTHFYRYDVPIAEHPWRVMMRQYPGLQTARDAAHRAFLAGYVAHLSIDEVWTEDMLRKWFVDDVWGSERSFRFFMLHILLIYMDERDYAGLAGWQAEALRAARPAGWLPFMSDADLSAWRDFIADQISGGSQTLTVLGARVQRAPEEFRAVLDSLARMEADLWSRVPRGVLDEVEQRMYACAREQMVRYLEESALAV